MKGVDRDTVAMLLALSAEQVAKREINEVNLHIRDSHAYRESETGRRRPGSTARKRIVTITLTVEGAHGDAWYHASTGQPIPAELLASAHGLPPLEAEPAPSKQITTAGPWMCGHCSHMNGASATTCRQCGK
jgi:hypothetical protein